jgi:hypothetical protein
MDFYLIDLLLNLVRRNCELLISAEELNKETKSLLIMSTSMSKKFKIAKDRMLYFS